MKIAVINGSPKGKYSITLQTINYLQRKYPALEFDSTPNPRCGKGNAAEKRPPISA